MCYLNQLNIKRKLGFVSLHSDFQSYQGIDFYMKRQLASLCLLVICTALFTFVGCLENEEDGGGTVIGIDLGTTYSCVGIFRYGRVEIIANDQGNRITPSYVAFTSNGERLVGDAAKNQVVSNPENTVFDVKRLIGRNWNEESVQADIKQYPFKVINKNNKPHIGVQTADGEKIFAPEEISAMVLGKMKETAEQYLGKKIKKAVVTVPAYFNFAQRQATIDAGAIAGLNIMRILNEPTAAALAYGLDKKEHMTKILVFDLGGGTFDVSLLSINNGVFKVLATNGDTHLGGEDFDHRVIEHFISLYKRKKGKDIKNDNRAIQKLRREVEKGKRILSFAQQIRLEIDGFFQGEDFSETLTRARFEELNMDLFQNTMMPLQQVLEDAKLQKSDVNELVLVGGSTRIPKIQQLVKEFFEGKEPSRDINPDEAVAYGAAINGAVLSGTADNYEILLQDVTPLTMGINILGGVAHSVIPRNTPIPVKRSDIFTTVSDDQTGIKIEIFEGERAMTMDNHLLGVIHLNGIQPEPRGVPKIKVTFEVDANGVLKVTSEDLKTSIKEEITIVTNEDYLSTEDIEHMISEAEKYADEDKIRLEKVNARNRFESYIYSVRSLIKSENQGPKLSAENRKIIDKLIQEMLVWIESNSNAEVDDYNEKMEEFQNLMHPFMVGSHRIRDEL